ncbi:uncharacterized protein (DUF1499 family) [Hoeflea marina]|uniref:Uncharacterized protein (DUF1499 family) n=1 Tax=Hoeflea marina TaxID=274592 RepID=A0A317PFQ9_9HYPH|nr:DUF1499 domain-containing protein [Hoeflea marina]PWV97634.1 uncharacterized protein (DUF1499 family) [Hoeflea marina]
MFKSIALALLAIVALLILAVLFIGRERTWVLLAGSPDREQFDFGAGRRSAVPNDALACSQDLCDNPDIIVDPRSGEPADVLSELGRRLKTLDPHARRLDTDKDQLKARYVTYTRWMRFPDVIHFEAVPLADGMTGIMAYSRSQLGNNDFGKNRARLEQLLKP